MTGSWPSTTPIGRTVPWPAGHPGHRIHRPPKAIPAIGEPADRTHDRVREDRVSKTGNVTLRHGGRLHHIGIGRIHAGTDICLLVEDLQIRVIDAVTGELLREPTLDPTRDYQPRRPRQTNSRTYDP